MAQRTERAKAIVDIDGLSAEESLKKLSARSKELKASLDDLKKNNDLTGFNKAEKELKQVDRAMASMKKTAVDTTAILKNMNGSSLRELGAAQRALLSDMVRVKDRNTDTYRAQVADLEKVEAQMKKVKTEMHGMSAPSKGMNIGGIAEGFNKYFGMFTAAAASIGGLVLGFKSAVDAANQFEDKLANLSALTGLTGNDLKFMSDAAKELSTSTLDGGIKITKSADEILDAFTKMGSARPELLKDKDALAEVTKQALILAEAGKMDLDTSISAVAATMNQFGLKASEAGRIINVLAAGSLEGSAEVDSLSGSLKNVGAVANDSNMTIEQTVATLEVLGEKQLKGEEAGTKLRGALLKLKEAGVGYASGQFNMRDALEEVNKKLAKHSNVIDQDALKIKVFGAENVTAGTILLGSIDKYDTLTKAVTGTSVANQQAAINTATNSAALAQAKNKAGLMAIELGQKLAPALTFSTNAFTYLMRAILATIKFYQEHSRIINSTLVGIAAYTAVVYGVTAAKKVYTVVVNMATAATRIFNTAIKSSPWGLIAGLIAAAAAAVLIFKENLSSANKIQAEMNDIALEAKKQTLEQKFALEQLLEIAKDETKSLVERKKALKKINEISPEYLGNITLDEIKTGKATTAINEYIASLERKNKSQILSERILAEQNKQLDLTTKVDENSISYAETAWAILSNPFNRSKGVSDAITYAARNQSKAYAESVAMMKKYEEELKNLQKSTPSIETNKPDPTKPTGGTGKLSDEEKKKAEEKLKLAIETQKKIQQALMELDILQTKDEFDRLDKEKQKELTFLTGTWEEQNVQHLLITEKYNQKEEELNKKLQDEKLKTFKKSLDAENKAAKKYYDKLVADKKNRDDREVSAAEQLVIRKLRSESFLKESGDLKAAKKEKENMLASKEYEMATMSERELMVIAADEKILEARSRLVDKYTDYAKNAYDIVSQYIEQSEANKNSRAISRLEDQRDAELKNSNLTEQQKAIIQEQYDAKIRAIKQKAWKAQQKADSLKLVVDGGLATARAWAEGGGWQQILAKGIAISAAQVSGQAIIWGQKMPEFSKGGATGTGTFADRTNQKVAGIVHANEYVIPAWERRIPAVMNMERIIEGIRLNRGFAAGGETTPTNTTAASSVPIIATDPAMLTAITELNAQLKAGLKTNFVYTEFEKMDTKIKNLKAMASTRG